MTFIKFIWSNYKLLLLFLSVMAVICLTWIESDPQSAKIGIGGLSCVFIAFIISAILTFRKDKKRGIYD